MENNTSIFIFLIKKMIHENETFFSKLKNLKKQNSQLLKEKIFLELGLLVPPPYEKPIEIIKSLIKDYISNNSDEALMDFEILDNISKQLQIEYLQHKIKKEDFDFYCYFSGALKYYGICRFGKITSFDNHAFWKYLTKTLYIIKLLDSNNYYHNAINTLKIKSNPINTLVNSSEKIKSELDEDIDIVDGAVSFKIGQEDRILSKVEARLSELNLFNALRFIFNVYEDDKNHNKIENTIPYKYLINILIKNIANSSHEINDIELIVKNLDILISFVSLYQLEEDNIPSLNINSYNLVSHLRKQVLYSNYFPIYQLSTITLVEYINNIIIPSINEDSFFSEFGFKPNELIDFFLLLGEQKDDIISFSLENIVNNEGKILDFFSVDANIINGNYGTISNLFKRNNSFSMNPIIKYDNTYYVIGFRYFKLNFYNSLLDKIRKSKKNKIKSEIGFNIDAFVEEIFLKIKEKHDYDIFSGNYTPPENETPESDLLIKTKNDIILIENKNKYLTHNSFSGSGSDILKDFIFSFAFSQKQLLKHERNIRVKKKIEFIKERKELIYSGQNILKISISTNNWYSIMNNFSSDVLLALVNLRFDINESEKSKKKNDFYKANKYLEQLSEVISELKENSEIDINVTLTQTAFLPLELIVEKYKDDDFIDILKILATMKMNTNNILNIYDYYKYLKSYVLSVK
ncbi:hypothetical protein [Providencia sp. PROV258]|uniref:hypothetical protein n=1 Tax=Providencia sp. PROV258 TaxID=2949946 RepID=UPI00234BB90B|nr:hypothetical protein [Providencia sp. PROV258]